MSRKTKVPSLRQERAQLHAQEGQRSSRSSLDYEPIKPNIITVISLLFILMQFSIPAVIMSHFSHRESFGVNKGDSAPWKKFAIAK